LKGQGHIFQINKIVMNVILEQWTGKEEGGGAGGRMQGRMEAGTRKLSEVSRIPLTCQPSSTSQFYFYYFNLYSARSRGWPKVQIHEVIQRQTSSCCFGRMTTYDSSMRPWGIGTGIQRTIQDLENINE